MRLAFWPGLGGGSTTLAEVAPLLHARGIDAVTVDPRYGTREDWRLGSLGDELAATGADVYGGHSWGAAVAATAACARPPHALVLLDGGHIDSRDCPRLGAADTTDGRVAEIRAEHEGYRWPSEEAYLEFCRSSSPRWNETLQAMALEGMRRRDGQILPPFDADCLESIIRGYEAYDAVATLSALAPDVRVLLVAAGVVDEHAAARDELVGRFAAVRPEGEIRRVATGHDVVWGLGPELGTLVADWLLAETVA